jgi:hypothetical protein
MLAILRHEEYFGVVGKNLEAERQVVDRGEAGKQGGSQGREAVPISDEDEAVCSRETREMSRPEIGRIWGFSGV